MLNVLVFFNSLLFARKSIYPIPPSITLYLILNQIAYGKLVLNSKTQIKPHI